MLPIHKITILMGLTDHCKFACKTNDEKFPSQFSVVVDSQEKEVQIGSIHFGYKGNKLPANLNTGVLESRKQMALGST